MSYPLQVNMTRGEVTPYMHARVDTEFYQAGLAEARNVVVTRYGGVMRVPGTLYEGPAKNPGSAARLLPYVFNRSQVYALEFGDLYLRFWTPNGIVESAPGVPYEIVTPYPTASLYDIRTVTSGDVVYIWCNGFQPRKLTRMSETNWAISLYAAEEGPYLPTNTTATALKPANYGAINPAMTSNNTPSGICASTPAYAPNSEAFYAFDHAPGVGSYASDVSGWTGGYISYTFTGGVTKAVDAYWLKASIIPTQMITAWTLQAFNGSSWIVLDTRTNEGGWGRAEVRYYEFANTTQYEAYKIVWDTTDTGSSSPAYIAEIAMHEVAEQQTPFNLTATAVTGINKGAGFLTTDVGRPIRLLADDGKWRSAIIISRVSSTVVTIQLYGHSLPSLSPITRWALGAWSAFTGWPKSGALFEDRLAHANTDSDPLGIWLSVSGDYENFRSSSPQVDDDGISLRVTGGELNDISWVKDARDLMAGTAGSLRAVGRNDPGKALSPSNARQRNETLTPSSKAEPISIENVMVFVDVFQQRLYEAAFTYETEGYVAREATTLNEHLFAKGIEQIEYLSTPHKYIVARRTDGKLVFFAYDREQKVAGGTLVDVGGFVESVTTLPGLIGTDLWMVVRRTVNGADVRYVERLAEFYRTDITTVGAPVYTACTSLYNGAPTNILTGATHLVGQTVGIWADGRDIGDAVVSNTGTITLPHEVVAPHIIIGLRMPARIQGLRLAQIGSQDGSGLGRKVDIVNAYVDIFESAGLRVGSLSQMDELQFEDEAEIDPDAPTLLRTGMFKYPVDDSWANNGVFVIETDSMFPFTIRGVQLDILGEP